MSVAPEMVLSNVQADAHTYIYACIRHPSTCVRGGEHCRVQALMVPETKMHVLNLTHFVGKLYHASFNLDTQQVSTPFVCKI